MSKNNKGKFENLSPENTMIIMADQLLQIGQFLEQVAERQTVIAESMIMLTERVKKLEDTKMDRPDFPSRGYYGL